MKKVLLGILLSCCCSFFCCLSWAVPCCADDEPLTLTVTYGEVTCGTPVTFTCEAAGGDGNYKYRMYYWQQVLEDGSTFDVIDPSKFVYQTSPDFTLEFYASGTYRLRLTVMGKVNGTFKTVNYSFTVVVSDPEYPTVEAKADAVYAACLAAGCATEAEKALWLHDWLVENVAYDYSYKYCNAEGALCRGKCTCEGYHRAYTMLLNRAGIENGRSQSTSLNHVWTAVKLGGAWYQVDVTHDDYGSAGSFYRHLYYGLPESVARLSRADYTGPGSEAYAYNYFIYTGQISTWSTPFVSEIQSALDADATTLSLDITAADPPSVIDILYSLVAWDLSQKTWTSGGLHPIIALSYDGANKKLVGTVTWPTESASESEVESEVGSDVESTVESESEIESEIESQTESWQESRQESKQESKQESRVESQGESQSEIQDESVLESKSESELESVAESIVESFPESQGESQDEESAESQPGDEQQDWTVAFVSIGAFVVLAIALVIFLQKKK